MTGSFLYVKISKLLKEISVGQSKGEIRKLESIFTIYYDI